MFPMPMYTMTVSPGCMNYCLESIDYFSGSMGGSVLFWLSIIVYFVDLYNYQVIIVVIRLV